MLVPIIQPYSPKEILDAINYPTIRVNTDNLREYANRLRSVQNSLYNVDVKLDLIRSKLFLFHLPSFDNLANLLFIDFNIGYSWKLQKCMTYLRDTASDFDDVEKNLKKEDPLEFKKPPVSGWKETFWEIGEAVKTGVECINSAVGDVVEYWSDPENRMRLIEQTKAVIGIAKGILKIGAGLTSVLSSGGVSLPVALAMIASGMNDVTSGLADLMYATDKNFEQIGQTNMLRDGLVQLGGTVGEWVGNKEAGEWIGRFSYCGIELLSSYGEVSIATQEFRKVNIKEIPQSLASVKENPFKGNWKPIVSLGGETTGMLFGYMDFMGKGGEFLNVAFTGKEKHVNRYLEKINDVGDEFETVDLFLEGLRIL